MKKMEKKPDSNPFKGSEGIQANVEVTGLQSDAMCSMDFDYDFIVMFRID